MLNTDVRDVLGETSSSAHLSLLSMSPAVSKMFVTHLTYLRLFSLPNGQGRCSAGAVEDVGSGRVAVMLSILSRSLIMSYAP